MRPADAGGATHMTTEELLSVTSMPGRNVADIRRRFQAPGG